MVIYIWHEGILILYKHLKKYNPCVKILWKNLGLILLGNVLLFFTLHILCTEDLVSVNPQTL